MTLFVLIFLLENTLKYLHVLIKVDVVERIWGSHTWSGGLKDYLCFLVITEKSIDRRERVGVKDSEGKQVESKNITMTVK